MVLSHCVLFSIQECISLAFKCTLYCRAVTFPKIVFKWFSDFEAAFLLDHVTVNLSLYRTSGPHVVAYQSLSGHQL